MKNNTGLSAELKKMIDSNKTVWIRIDDKEMKEHDSIVVLTYTTSNTGDTTITYTFITGCYKGGTGIGDKTKIDRLHREDKLIIIEPTPAQKALYG